MQSPRKAASAAAVLSVVALSVTATSAAGVRHFSPSDRFYQCRGGQFHLAFGRDKLAISSGKQQIASVTPSSARLHCSRVKGPAGRTSYIRTTTTKSTKLTCSTTQGNGRYIIEVYRSAARSTTLNIGWSVAGNGETSLFMVVRATVQPHGSSLSYWTACGPSG